MLLIERKQGESVVIGDNVEVCVEHISIADNGSKRWVGLRIKAPHAIPVIRLELCAKGDDHVRQSGEQPLHEIEDRLDWGENQ